MSSQWHPALFVYKNVGHHKWPDHTFRLVLRDQLACAGGVTRTHTFSEGEYRLKKRGNRTYLQVTKDCYYRDKRFFKQFDTYQNRVQPVVCFFQG